MNWFWLDAQLCSVFPRCARWTVQARYPHESDPFYVFSMVRFRERAHAWEWVLMHEPPGTSEYEVVRLP